MADAAKPNYPQILELPPGLTPAQFQTLVSDRIKDLNLLLRGVEFNPSVTDLDMGSFRITNLADPIEDLDGVNLRTLRRFGGTTTEAPAVTATGLDAYAMVFDNPGILADGSVSTAYVVGLMRTGTPVEAWFYLQGVGRSNSSINFQVQLGGVGPFVRLLASDLTISAGSLGPVFTSSFALNSNFPHGTVVEAVGTIGGFASGVSMGVVMKRR